MLQADAWAPNQSKFLDLLCLGLPNHHFVIDPIGKMIHDIDDEQDDQSVQNKRRNEPPKQRATEQSPCTMMRMC